MDQFGLRIWDFNPYVIDRYGGAQPGGRRVSVCTESSILKMSPDRLFLHDIVTTLRYREVAAPEPMPVSHYGNDYCFLDDKRLVTVAGVSPEYES